MSYEAGLAFACILWAASAVNTLIHINSQYERNLNRLGQRLSWLNLSPKPLTPQDQGKSFSRKTAKFLLVFGLALPLVLTSWLYVALVIGTMFHRWRKDAGAPQLIREYRWKLKNFDLPFDQLIKEVMKVADQDSADFARFRADMLADLRSRGLKLPPAEELP